MSQHDMDVANGAGVVVRADINNALQALASLSSGASAPNPTFPCQLWADTGTSRLRRRNVANNAWLDLGPIDENLRESASEGSYAADTGTANAYVCSFTPAITARSESTPIRFKAANANTGACTVNDGVGVVALVGPANAALRGGEITANGIAWIQWNSSVGGSGAYVLLFCTGADASQLQTQGMTAFTTTNSGAAFSLAPAPAIQAYATNQRFQVKFSANSTGADTLNISSKGAKSIKQFSSAGTKVPAVFASGMISDVVYDGTDMVVMDPVRGLTTSLVARLSSATVQAVTGTNITPQVYTPLSHSFTADGSLYQIFCKINLEVETINASTSASNAAVIKLLNGATPLDISASNISVPEIAGRSMVLAWSGTLSGAVALTTTFEKTWANGSITLNGDRDDNTSNISGQLSSIEIFRIGA